MELKTTPVLSVVVMLLVDVVLGEAENLGKWTAWTDWSGCSLSCGSGITTRTRYWQEAPGQKKFEKPFTFSENSGCNMGSCPQDGSWNVWGRWAACSEACGGGISRRTRKCLPPRNGGKDCDGDDFEEEDCNRLPCPPPPARFNLSSCTNKHFMCLSRRMCIPRKEQCDNTVQCDDGSDEKTCYDVNKSGSDKYAYFRDTGSTNAVSLSSIFGLVAMVIIMQAIR